MKDSTKFKEKFTSCSKISDLPKWLDPNSKRTNSYHMLRTGLGVGRREWLKETQKKKVLPNYGISLVIQVQIAIQKHH